MNGIPVKGKQKKKRLTNPTTNKILAEISEKVRKHGKGNKGPNIDFGTLTYEDVVVLPTKKTWKMLGIEDTFWEGKRKLIPDFSKMRAIDKHAKDVSCIE